MGDWVSPSWDEGLLGTGRGRTGLEWSGSESAEERPPPGAGRPCGSCGSRAGGSGADSRGRASGPVRSGRVGSLPAATWAPEPVRARSPVPPRWLVTTGRVMETVVTPRFPAWEEVWSVGDPFSPGFLGSGSQTTALPPLPPQCDKNCPNCQVPPCIPKPVPRSDSRIVTNYLPFGVHFQQTHISFIFL